MINSNNSNTPAPDQRNYVSDDGLVEVWTKTSVHRWPKHGYPCVVMNCRPKFATRIQPLKDGSGGVEIMLTHAEVAAHLRALQAASPGKKYVIPEIPEKPLARKKHWEQINRRRWSNRGGFDKS
jgi:hypothetical protein